MTSNNANRTHRLTMYTLAAGAAASTGATAFGEIIYSGIQNINLGRGSSINLDLNGDAQNDLLLKNYIFFGGNYQGATVNFFPGKLVGFNSGLAYVTALSDGAIIGPANAGPNFFGSLAYGNANPNAQFNTAANKFIGLSFPAGPDLFYGWARVSINNGSGSFVIHDWAYESVSGAPITTGVIPEPTLGLLATGAAGLLLVRRGRNANA